MLGVERVSPEDLFEGSQRVTCHGNSPGGWLIDMVEEFGEGEPT